MKFQVELRVPAEWERVEPTRGAVGLLALALFRDQDLGDALSMVSAELLENAVKYSRPDSVIVFRIDEDEDAVVIAVTNHAEEGHRQALERRVSWMATFASASDAYAAAMQELMTRAPGRSSSGLGIARIAYEGGCRVECDASLPNAVTVRARYPRAA